MRPHHADLADDLHEVHLGRAILGVPVPVRPRRLAAVVALARASLVLEPNERERAVVRHILGHGWVGTIRESAKASSAREAAILRLSCRSRAQCDRARESRPAHHWWFLVSSQTGSSRREPQCPISRRFGTMGFAGANPSAHSPVQGNADRHLTPPAHGLHCCLLYTSPSPRDS